MSSENLEISRLETANMLGLAYLKTVITLNAGAILALMTLIGGASNNKNEFLTIENVKFAIIFFLVGICSILLTLLVSYSFTATPDHSKYHQFWNRWIVLFNSLFAFLSLLAFVAGVFMIIIGIQI